REREDSVADRRHHHVGVEIGDTKLEDVPPDTFHRPRKRERADGEQNENGEQRWYDDFARSFYSGPQTFYQHERAGDDHGARAEELQQERLQHEPVVGREDVGDVERMT